MYNKEETKIITTIAAVIVLGVALGMLAFLFVEIARERRIEMAYNMCVEDMQEVGDTCAIEGDEVVFYKGAR